MFFDYRKSSNLLDALYEYYEVLRLCRATKRDLVLDIGCGLNFLKAVFEDNVIGVDIAINSRADIIADAQHLPFRDNSFDIVMSVELIEHLENIDKFMKELKRVSKKYICISTVNSLTGKHDERHVREYNLFSLRKLFRKHNITILDYGYGGVGRKKLGRIFRIFKPLRLILPWWIWCEWFCICGEVNKK